jgi:hypothetical protein
MPNWCSNHITVRGTDPAAIKRLADAFDAGEFCGTVVPMPDELNITSGSLGDPVEQAELEAKSAANLEKHGFANWYDFNVAKWGTKWEIGGNGDVAEIDVDGLSFSAPFESAWSPPIGVCEALAEQGFDVTLYYYEPGMGYVGKWEDGFDDYYEYEGETSKTVRAAIGDELDDMFGISESMAEYEAENEEEEELTEWLKDGIDKKAQLVAL